MQHLDLMALERNATATSTSPMFSIRARPSLGKEDYFGAFDICSWGLGFE